VRIIKDDARRMIWAKDSIVLRGTASRCEGPEPLHMHHKFANPRWSNLLTGSYN